MKKVLFWVMPLFLIACSLFSYQISKDYILQIKGNINTQSAKDNTNKNSTFNRPKIQSSLYSKTIIVINNSFDSSSFYSFSKSNLPDYWNKGIYGISHNEPVNDPKQALYMLLSGTNPNLSGIKNISLNQKLDDLILVSRQNKKVVGLFSSLEFDSAEKAQSSYKKIITDWKKYDILIFDFNKQMDQSAWKKQYFDPILKSISKTDLLFFCSLIPENTSKFFLKQNPTYQSPFLLSGNFLNTKANPVSINQEDMTATLAFSMGLSLPSDCLGYPELSFFNLKEPEKLIRGYSSVKNFIINSISLLYQYDINETIIAGFLMESTDSIDLSPAKTTQTLHQQYLSIKKELQNYTAETRQKNNLLVSLIFLILSLLFLVIWLLLITKYYRSFIFGLGFILIFFLFHYFVFRIPSSYPGNSLLSIRWFLFQSGIPLFLSAILVSAFYTIFSGYVFDITLSNAIEDLSAIVGTFGLFLLGEITYIVNLFGFKTRIVSPGYYYITMILRNLSLLILLSITLLIMIGVCFTTFKLLTKYGPKPNL